MADTFRYWSYGLMAAVRSPDHTVELVEGPRGGAQVEIDGIPMFNLEGYPHEQFQIVAEDRYMAHITEEGLQKLREIYRVSGGGES